MMMKKVLSSVRAAVAVLIWFMVSVASDLYVVGARSCSLIRWRCWGALGLSQQVPLGYYALRGPCPWGGSSAKANA